MNYVDEIVKRLSVYENFSENNIRIVLNDYNISPKCAEIVLANDDKRQKAIRRLMVFYEINQRLEEITADQIRYYIAVRSARDKLSKTSQDNELRVLKSFFKWCSGEEYIGRNPTENIKAVKKEKRIKKPFSETELELIREKAGNKRDRAIVEVLYSTGVRVSELCGMDINDIANDEIIVFGKGEKERTVYLNARAKIAVSEYLKTRRDTDSRC